MKEEDTLTITELIEQLEELRSEHGDLPVVYTEEIWHIVPNPEVTEGKAFGVTDGPQYLRTKRVEL